MESQQNQKQIDTDQLVDALKEALVYPGQDRPALVARIPVICNDIREIKNHQQDMVIKQEKMANDMGWQKWLLFSIAAGIGFLALKSLGALP